MNALLKLFLDAVMALAAGGGEVPWVDTRRRVVSRQNAVSRMAVRAHRRDGKTAFHEPFAVNALRVPLDDLMFRSLVAHRGLFPFAVTLGAEIGNIRREG